ncbi:MAG TPA: hypothetical protein VIK14_05245 [Ignavibacteria bacterium]
MALKKRKPGSIVVKAETRLKGMEKIDKNYFSVIDYGGPTNPLSSKEVKTQIQYCLEMNKQYNDALKIADVKVELLKEAETKLAEMYSRILSGCVSKFGIDAPEITLLGGTRKSERKNYMKKINK